MSETGSQRAVRLFFSACVALNFSCSHSSPTEPMVSRVNLDLAVTPILISSEENGLVVQSNICACTKNPVTVSINASMAGTVNCFDVRSLPVPAGAQRVEILVESPEINPVKGAVFFNAPVPGGSFRVPITLTCSPR